MAVAARLTRLAELIGATPLARMDYQRIVDVVSQALGLACCALWSLDAARGCLSLVSASTGFDAQARATLPSTLPIDDAAPAPMTGVLQPLIAGDRTIGMLYGEDEHGHTAQYLRLAAPQIVLAIERIRLHAQETRLTLLSTMSRALADPSSVQRLCDRLAGTLHEIMGYHVTGVYLREGDELLLAAYYVPSGTPPVTARQLSIGPGIIGHAAATNLPYLCSDTRDDPHFHLPSDVANTRSELAVPLSIGADLVGVINVESPHPGSFTDDDRDALVAVAGQAATAIRNARLYEAEAELRRRAELRLRRLEQVQQVSKRLAMDLDERSVGQLIVNAACEALGFRMAILNLFDRPGDPTSRARVVATAGVPPEGVEALRAHDFPFSAVVDLLRPEYLLSNSYFIPAGATLNGDANEVPTWTPALANSGEDAWQAGDELLVPLTGQHGGNLVGFLSVDDPRNGRRPEREEVEVLEIFANQAVVALRNSGLLAQARRQAERDPVTGLLNHRAIHQQLGLRLAEALEQGQSLGIVAIDMDDFKLINDAHGHAAGDMALRHVAALLERCVRAGDLVARLGGDEFLVILQDATLQRSTAVVERIEALIRERPLYIEGTGAVPLGLSCGIALAPNDATEPHTLVTLADTRLYAVKRAGGRGEEIGARAGRQGEGTRDGNGLLSALVAAVDEIDANARAHAERVASVACALADSLGLSAASQRALRIAGLFHDVGKIGVPEAILRKQGPLDAHEREIMRQHVKLSITLLRATGAAPDVLSAVSHHHERWDGAGYPSGVGGNATPLLGRILVIAEAISAMSVACPYQTALPAGAIAAELQREAGAQFDPELVGPATDIVARLLDDAAVPEGRQSLDHLATRA